MSEDTKTITLLVEVTVPRKMKPQAAADAIDMLIGAGQSEAEHSDEVCDEDDEFPDTDDALSLTVDNTIPLSDFTPTMVYIDRTIDPRVKDIERSFCGVFFMPKRMKTETVKAKIAALWKKFAATKQDTCAFAEFAAANGMRILPNTTVVFVQV